MGSLRLIDTFDPAELINEYDLFKEELPYDHCNAKSFRDYLVYDLIKYNYTKEYGGIRNLESKFFKRTLDFVLSNEKSQTNKYQIISKVSFLIILPNGEVLLHKDGVRNPTTDVDFMKIQYHKDHDRYATVLKTGGSYFKCGEDVVDMQPGEIWWFNQRVKHESHNTSDVPRVMLAWDCYPRILGEV